MLYTGGQRYVETPGQHSCNVPCYLGRYGAYLNSRTYGTLEEIVREGGSIEEHVMVDRE